MATFLQNLGRGIDTIGRRLGNPLPELGISERLVGKTYASSPAKPNYTPAPKPKNYTPAPWTVAGPPPGTVLGSNTNSLGGGNVGGGSSGGGGQPQQSYDFNQAYNAGAPEAPSIDFDALIRPALDALESTVPTLQQGFNEYQTGQQGAQQTQLASSRQNIGEQERLLGQSRTQQQQAGESAIDEARRQFSEIQQGLQARYGGTTGTGRFAGELAGRESLRNIGNIRTALGGAMQQIDDKLVQVKEIGRIAEQDIVQKTEERIRQARENLNLQIADIRRQQGVLQADKARMSADLISQYQNSVNQFKSEQGNFLRNLFVQQTNAENQLKQALQKAGETTKSLTFENYNKLAQQATNAGLSLSASGRLGQGGTFENPSFSISPQKKEDLENPFLNS